jgi:gingipain R
VSFNFAHKHLVAGCVLWLAIERERNLGETHKDSFGPIFSLSTPFVMRDIRGINARFNPYQYNQSTGLTKVTTHLKVAIRRSHSLAGVNEIATPHLTSPGFDAVYRSYFNNGIPTEQLDSAHAFPASYTVGGMIVITGDTFKEAMLPFVQWKIERGIPSKIVTMSEIGGKRSADDIYAFLKREYAAWRPAHIVLVGDSEFVPTRKGTDGNVVNRAADPTYANLEGDDAYPDAIVSRLSAKTPRDVQVMVQRTLRYEKSPDVNSDWMSHHLGIASNERYSDNLPKDWERMRVLQDILRTGDFTRFTEVFDPGARAEVISNAVNNGVGFVNYLGHGMLDSWVTSGFSNADVARLKNYGKWPVVLSVACVNGTFTSELGDALGEAWTKAGTPENPTGAIAMLASSTSQSWVPPAKGQKRAMELLAQHARTTVGELLFAASIAVLDDNSNTAVQTFQSWHIFGDGTAVMHTKNPTLFAPQIPATPAHGMQDFKVNGIPNFALVALTAGSKILTSGYASANGEFVAPIEIPADALSVKLTITGHNVYPYQREFMLDQSRTGG